MKLVALLKLVADKSQKLSLKKTVETTNAACNYLSEVAWSTKTFGQFALHTAAYADTRQKFDLSAQIVVRAIAKVADAYKLQKGAKRAFRSLGSIAYDERILTYRTEKRFVSIWSVDGRLKLPYQCGPKQHELLKTQQGESDLLYVKGEFYLAATCEVEEPTPDDFKDFLGVDLGIKNIATTSDGKRFSGGHLNGLRKRYHRVRKNLQKKGTKSATRLLVKRKRKEGRFAKDVNHCISKYLVDTAKDTNRAVALENLKGIRERTTVRKRQRYQHSSWSFAQLTEFVKYKAKRLGVTVVQINPRNTSRTCPACGCIDKRNRPSQSKFLCIRCGHVGHADHIAAENIRRAAVNQPNVTRREIA